MVFIKRKEKKDYWKEHFEHIAELTKKNEEMERDHLEEKSKAWIKKIEEDVPTVRYAKGCKKQYDALIEAGFNAEQAMELTKLRAIEYMKPIRFPIL